MTRPSGLPRYPLLRSLFLRQLVGSLVVLFTGGLVLCQVTALEVDRSHRELRQQITTALDQQQEDLRAKALMGLTAALAAQAKDLRKEIPAIKSIRVVNADDKETTISDSDGKLTFPREAAPDVPLKVLVRYDVPSPFSLLLSKTNLASFFVGVAMVLLLLWSQWRNFTFVRNRLIEPILNGVPGVLSDSSFSPWDKSGSGNDTEIDLVLREVQSTYQKYLDLERAREEAEHNEALAKLASQVAHDIQSPLVALEVVAEDLQLLPEEERLLLRNAVSRISDIANNLLQKAAPSSRVPDDLIQGGPSLSPQLIGSLVEPILSEKRLQFRSLPSVQVRGRTDSAYGLFAKVDPTEFKRVLSNLINNAVEAFDGEGLVTVALGEKENGKKLLIIITDNGKGIPASVLPKLTERGQTYGKANGNGLGLHHAKISVQNWGGDLSIESTEGAGTTITIILPTAMAPSWFAKSLSVDVNRSLVILDDDPSIHRLWQTRLRALDKAFDNQALVLHFTHTNPFEDWASSDLAIRSVALFLVDYELLGSPLTGLELITKLGIESRSILVTSHFDNPQIITRCREAGVRLLPKCLAAYAPIELKRVDKCQGPAYAISAST